jgi:hypothetical protein
MLKNGVDCMAYALTLNGALRGLVELAVRDDTPQWLSYNSRPGLQLPSFLICNRRDPNSEQNTL